MAAVAWITIDVTDLNDYEVAAQVTALRTAALARGQSDPFDNIMVDVVGRIRLKIESCDRNKLSLTPNSIPPELKSMACYLILQAMQVRIPSMRLSESQIKQIDKYESDLTAIAKCDLVISKPIDPEGEDTAQRSTGIWVVSGICRKFTRSQVDGL